MKTTAAATLPHLSHSRVSRYLTCPEQYRLHYVEGLRPLVPPASLPFGKAVHESLAHLLLDGGNAVDYFASLWMEQRESTLNYGYHNSWEKLNERGAALLAKFTSEELPAIETIEAVEKSFELAISSLDVPFVGVIDLVAQIGGRRVVVDFKTSGTAYSDHDAPLSDQLAAYRLADPEADDSAFCVLRKGKEPRIDWHYSGDAPAQLPDLVRKIEIVGQQISEEQFYRRPGGWCQHCPFLGICMGGDPAESTVQVRIGDQNNMH